RSHILLAFEKAEIERNPEKQKALLTFAIVGGGPTGCELAGAIAELAHRALAKDFRHINPKSTRIVLIEAGPRILPTFPEKLSRKAASSLKRLGVEIKTGTRVELVSSGVVGFATETVAADNIIWAAGVTASPAGKWLKARTDKQGRVFVNENLEVPELPGVFVIGDTAHVPTADGQGLPGVAPVAIQQGKYLARLLNRRIHGKSDAIPFVYFDKGNLATIGRSAAVADLGKLKISGFPAWVLWCFIHIAYLIGFRNRVLVLIQWAWAYATFQKGARLITRI
ncbi:MAG: FAD-dependent oxidoreductase, partial [Bdellovibrionia bacterium]